MLRVVKGFKKCQQNEMVVEETDFSDGGVSCLDFLLNFETGISYIYKQLMR